MNSYTAAEIDAMSIEEIEQVASMLTEEARIEWAESGYSGESYQTLGMNDAERELARLLDRVPHVAQGVVGQVVARPDRDEGRVEGPDHRDEEEDPQEHPRGRLPHARLDARAVVFLATGGVPALFASRYQGWLAGEAFGDDG